MKPQQTWTTISVPIEMADNITEIMRDRKELGYKSVSEFIRDATRAFIQYLKEQEAMILQRGKAE